MTQNLEEARAQNLSYEEFLYGILQKEYDSRVENGKLSRIRIAGFPAKKYLEDLKTEDLPVDCRNKLKILASIDFVKHGQNIILYVNPGTGKTHMAIGLGIKACTSGFRVLFTTVPILINQLKEARGALTLRSFELRFEKYDLVIADELGYISF